MPAIREFGWTPRWTPPFRAEERTLIATREGGASSSEPLRPVAPVREGRELRRFQPHWSVQMKVNREARTRLVGLDLLSGRHDSHLVNYR